MVTKYHTFHFFRWQKNNRWHQNSYEFFRSYSYLVYSMEFRPKSKWIQLMIYVKKCKIKLLIKLTCIKKCKTQVVHLKINPVFDTVKIITIYLFASFKADTYLRVHDMLFIFNQHFIYLILSIKWRIW